MNTQHSNTMIRRLGRGIAISGAAGLFAIAATLPGCEDAGDEATDAMEEAGDAAEDAIEDAGDAIEDAGDELGG